MVFCPVLLRGVLWRGNKRGPGLINLPGTHSELSPACLGLQVNFPISPSASHMLDRCANWGPDGDGRGLT